MIKSMTAFASSETEIDNLSINCELRSVNHRYCDISLKLPEQFKMAEADIRSSISSQLKRGKIECTLSFKKQAKIQYTISVDDEAVKALLKATAQIEEHMHTHQPFTALDILKYPGIQQDAKINKQTLLLGINSLVKDGVKKLLIEREREGSQLTVLLEQRCDKIHILVKTANTLVPIVLEKMRRKIKLRIAELEAEPDIDRLEQEMVYLAQKLDVAEELDRLETHLIEVLNVLKKDEPVGRRLDFLMQEMNREANTLGSKSADKEMTQISINLKVLIEQMREQIQNIE